MTMMSDLIEAYLRDPGNEGLRATLLDALSVTGPLRHGLLRWEAGPGQIINTYAYWWGYEDIPAAADTPIPR